MTTGLGVEKPADKISTAQATFELAIRLSGEVHAGRISSEIFARQVIVHTGSSGLALPSFPQGTQQDLEHGISNLVLIALSASALTVDETLDQVFGAASSDTEPTRRGIRVLVHQLRNAFAHNPWRPKWVVFEKYRGVYPVRLMDGSTFSF